MDKQTVSVVIPLYDEEENLRPLVDDLLAALKNFDHPWELVFVDDGSNDATRRGLDDLAGDFGGALSIIELQRNFGQTAAMQAGIDFARGDILVTLDGDLQNDPADIPGMVQNLIEEDLDLLVGWRKNRQDTWLTRKLPSRLANWLIGRLSGVHLHDYGCSLKVYRGDVVRGLRIYGEMHRFIPALMAMHTKTSRIKEQVVNHRARQFGKSKYGISRTWRVLLDLLSVYFFMSFRTRPAHFFGRIGFALGLPGVAILAWLMYVRIVLGEDIGGRPLLLVGALLVIMAIQSFSTGILGEYMTRIYHESTGTKPFVVRERSSTHASNWM